MAWGSQSGVMSFLGISSTWMSHCDGGPGHNPHVLGIFKGKGNYTSAKKRKNSESSAPLKNQGYLNGIIPAVVSTKSA